MTTPTKRTRGDTAKGAGRTAADKPAGKTAEAGTATARGKAAQKAAQEKTAQSESAQHRGEHGHDVTVTIPVDRAANAAAKVVALPVATAQRVLPAKGGLPLYLGLGALGIAGVLEWPVAVGIGVGYAVLRRGPLNPGTTQDAETGEGGS